MSIVQSLIAVREYCVDAFNSAAKVNPWLVAAALGVMLAISFLVGMALVTELLFVASTHDAHLIPCCPLRERDLVWAPTHSMTQHGLPCLSCRARAG